MLADFKEFLTKTNALALAVAVIIGGAVGKVGASLVAVLRMPVFGLALGGGGWRGSRSRPGRTEKSSPQ